MLAGVVLLSSLGHAQSIATVSELSGSLLVRRGDGSIHILAPKSRVEAGEILQSREGSYASLALSDQALVTLGPDTRVALDLPVSGGPAGQIASIKLAQGELRVSSHTESIIVITPVGQLQIKEATLIARLSAPEIAVKLGSLGPRFGYAPGPQSLRLERVAYRIEAPQSGRYRLAQNVPGQSSPNPGLYVQVLKGQVSVSSAGGTQSFSAGQFGFVSGASQPPVIVPTNPGIQFTPPPSFSASAGGSSSAGSKPGDVDCVVR